MADSVPVPSLLTDEEKDAFGMFLAMVKNGEQIALLRVYLDGKPEAAVVLVEGDEDDEEGVTVTPQLLITPLSSRDFDRLMDPNGRGMTDLTLMDLVARMRSATAPE